MPTEPEQRKEAASWQEGATQAPAPADAPTRFAHGYNNCYSWTVLFSLTTVPVTIAAGTDFDKVRIGWGDGSTSTSYAATSVTNLPAHQYLRFDKYRYTSDGVPGYRYGTIVQLFKGTTLVSSKAFKVFVAE